MKRSPGFTLVFCPTSTYTITPSEATPRDRGREVATRHTGNLSRQFHHRTIIQQSRLRDDDRTFDVAGRSHEWTEGSRPRQSRQIDALKRKHDVADFDGITAIPYDASDRKRWLRKNDIHLPNFQVVRPKVLLTFGTSERIRNRSCGADNLVAVSCRNSIPRSRG